MYKRKMMIKVAIQKKKKIIMNIITYKVVGRTHRQINLLVMIKMTITKMVNTMMMMMKKKNKIKTKMMMMKMMNKVPKRQHCLLMMSCVTLANSGLSTHPRCFSTPHGTSRTFFAAVVLSLRV